MKNITNLADTVKPVKRKDSTNGGIVKYWIRWNDCRKSKTNH